MKILDPELNESSGVHFVIHPELALPIASAPLAVHPEIEACIANGRYEVTEARAAEKLIGEDDRVLELGGGLGALAAYICRNCRPSSYDVVEANPDILPLLKATLVRNTVRGVQVHNCLLTNDENDLSRGWGIFYIPEDKEFWVGSTQQHRAESKQIKLSTRSFTEFLLERRPTIVICDIEGGELNLFGSSHGQAALRERDGVNPLGSVRAIVMVYPWAIGDGGVTEIRQCLQECGFFVAEESRGVVTFKTGAI